MKSKDFNINSVLNLIAVSFLCLMLFYGTTSGEEQKPNELAKQNDKTPQKLSIEEQEKLAKDLFSIMIKTDNQDFKTFISLYERVIKECPDTEKAQISLWRLSNLYQFGMDKPDNKKVVELMGYLISRYPDSPLLPNAKQRLLRTYEDIGEMKKALELYEELFNANPDAMNDSRVAATMLGYAKALSATGNKRKALELYKKVCDFGDKIEDFLVDAAKDAIQELNNK